MKLITELVCDELTDEQVEDILDSPADDSDDDSPDAPATRIESKLRGISGVERRELIRVIARLVQERTIARPVPEDKYIACDE